MSRPFPRRRALLFAGLLLFLVLATSLITNVMNEIWHWHSIVVIFLGESLLSLIAVFLLSRFHWWRAAGLRAPRYSPAFFCLLAPCFILISDADTVVAVWNFIPGHNNALIFFILAMLVGFVEEVYFRGLILRSLLARGSWLAAIISSALFGALHLLHLLAGQNLTATLLQVASATATGFLFAAVALRTQSILPLIVIHGLTDFVAFVGLNGTLVTYTPDSDVIIHTVVEALVYVTLGVIAMRGMRAPDIEADTLDRHDKTLVEAG